MSLTDIDDVVAGDRQIATEHSGEYFNHDDPWFMPREGLQWFDHEQNNHYIYADSEYDSVEELMWWNKRSFPDLYKDV